jgi:hypothetical protein
MTVGLQISVVDQDDDYLGINIAAATDRFAGQTRIYAGPTQLSEFASVIEGFPVDFDDARTYEFGNRDPAWAGGYAQLTFSCISGSGLTQRRIQVAVTIEDDKNSHAEASATFWFEFQPAELDRFVRLLRDVESSRDGEASLLGVPPGTL